MGGLWHVSCNFLLSKATFQFLAIRRMAHCLTKRTRPRVSASCRVFSRPWHPAHIFFLKAGRARKVPRAVITRRPTCLTESFVQKFRRIDAEILERLCVPFSSTGPTGARLLGAEWCGYHCRCPGLKLCNRTIAALQAVGRTPKPSVESPNLAPFMKLKSIVLDDKVESSCQALQPFVD